jgi:hypothetical protein
VTLFWVERRLHAGQNALRTTQNNVTDMAVTIAGAFFATDDAFKTQFLKPTIAKMGNADFARPRVDEYLSRHGRRPR